MNQAKSVLKKAMASETYNMDAIMDCMDQFKFSIKISQEKDLEIEAQASAYLGHLLFRCFHKNEKANGYFKRSIRICDALKPKSFTSVKWYKTMVKEMDAINKETMKKDGSSQSDLALRRELKSEIDELWSKKTEGTEKFLKLCVQKYKNWKNETVELSEEDLKNANIKKTILKTVFHYHPDRKA